MSTDQQSGGVGSLSIDKPVAGFLKALGGRNLAVATPARKPQPCGFAAAFFDAS